MIVAVIAVIVAVAALAVPYAFPAAGSARKASTPQTMEFYVVSTEWNMDTIPSGLNHYGFTPDTITVNQGDTVVIHFYNTHDDTPHTFTLPAYNLNVNVPADQNKTFSFTAAQAGTFVFTCSYHAPTMRGELVVLPA